MKLLGRYQNGNYTTLIFSDGTKIRQTEDDDFRPAFAENCDIKITNMCDMNCPMCHENSTADGKHGDLNMKFLETLHPYTELALGGGNALLHPQLVPFLEKLQKQKVIANLTVNQKHFEENIDFLKDLCDKKLIYGLGVSLTRADKDFVDKIKLFPTAVVHTINGMLSKEQIDVLKDNDLKMLILGFKNFRRGSTYLAANSSEIEAKQKYLYDNLGELTKHFNLISFDNLALEQLNVRRLLADKEWEQFYMGDDGTMTFYIDLVNKQFASSSISTKRYPITDSIDDMFKTVLEEKNAAI